MSDPSWIRSCERLTNALSALEKKKKTIERSTINVIAVKDISKEREKVRQTTSGANSAIVPEIEKEVRLMQGFIGLNPALSGEGMDLMNDAKALLRGYQEACDKFYKKCMSVEEANRSRMNSRTSRAFRDGSEEEGEGDALLGGGSSQATQRMQFEKSLYEELMLEREQETREIAENVQDINEIFAHIHGMVEEQGVQLNIVDDNISVAERATRNANTHLSRAQQYQTTSNCNKLLLILVIAVFFITVFGLLVG